MKKTKTKRLTYCYKLVMSFNTLQQHVAQHPLLASFNKPILILTDIQRVDGS